MKDTIKSWLIANSDSVSAFLLISIILRLKHFENSMQPEIAISTLQWILIGVCIIIGLTVSTIVSIYTYNNFSEVVSRRMLWRNSNVSMFNERLKYSINRFGSTFFCVILFMYNIYMFFK